eukprot:gene36657-47785_t
MGYENMDAAHSIVRLHDPTLHSDRHGDPLKLVRLRDFSIGLRDDKSSRLIVESNLHHLTAAEKRIRDNKLTSQELTQFLCWEDLAILACDNREPRQRRALLEDERGARLLWETRKKDLLLEMEELQVNVTVTQRREADLEAALAALRDRYAAAESQWKFEREAAQRELDQAARKEHELRSELVMALEAHQPPTVGWRVELDNTRQELDATKRELLAARRVIDSLHTGESHHAPGLREESMGTADFGSASPGFPPFQELPPSPPPQNTASGGGQTSTLPVPTSGVPIGGEDGESSSGELAFSQRPKDRESRETLPGVTALTESRHHFNGAPIREQRGQEARSHYGPGGRGVAGLSPGGATLSMGMRPPLPIHTVVHTGGGLFTQGISGQTLSSPSRGVSDQTLAAVTALVVPGSMKKVMLASLEIADLRKFREIFRYHLNNGDNCTGWWQFVPKDFWAPIRRRLQNMRDPSTQRNKYTVAAAAGWQDIGVIECLDDLINAIALPAVAGLPLTTALG